MKSQQKNIILVVVLFLIVAGIWYLESTKPQVAATDVQNISVSATTAAMTATSSSTTSPVSAASSAQRIAQKVAKYPPAKELAGIQGYINSPAVLTTGVGSSTAPFKLADLIGKKVILLDFWTYSCINCIRTVPYLNAWYQKYKDDGLVIVCVHTPEFDFEKNFSNVSDAVKRLGIQYPVVLDSNMATWNVYKNMYWPHEYLIDIDGFISHDHIGEGGYDETEAAIQAALKERAQVLGVNETISSTTTTPTNVIAMDAGGVQSPETYFGAARNEYLGNGNFGTLGAQTLTIPTAPQANTLYLGGTWNFQDQFAVNTSASADIVFNYSSKNVYIVAAADKTAPAAGVKAKIFIDGKLITAAQAGADVAADGTVTITGNRLYSIVNGSQYGQHVLHIEVEGAGLDAFTFTFG